MGQSIRTRGRTQEQERASLGELIHQHVRGAIERAVHEELLAAAVIRKILAHMGVSPSGPSPGPAPPEPGGAAS
jgi:hypothetical protein